MFKLGSDLNDYFVSGIKIVKNLDDPNLCSTQIKCIMDKDAGYFLHNSLGNHHMISKKIIQVQ